MFAACFFLVRLAIFSLSRPHKIDWLRILIFDCSFHVSTNTLSTYRTFSNWIWLFFWLTILWMVFSLFYGSFCLSIRLMLEPFFFSLSHTNTIVVGSFFYDSFLYEHCIRKKKAAVNPIVWQCGLYFYDLCEFDEKWNMYTEIWELEKIYEMAFVIWQHEKTQTDQQKTKKQNLESVWLHGVYVYITSVYFIMAKPSSSNVTNSMSFHRIEKCLIERIILDFVWFVNWFGFFLKIRRLSFVSVIIIEEQCHLLNSNVRESSLILSTVSINSLRFLFVLFISKLSLSFVSRLKRPFIIPSKMVSSGIFFLNKRKNFSINKLDFWQRKFNVYSFRFPTTTTTKNNKIFDRKLYKMCMCVCLLHKTTCQGFLNWPNKWDNEKNQIRMFFLSKCPYLFDTIFKSKTSTVFRQIHKSCYIRLLHNVMNQNVRKRSKTHTTKSNARHEKYFCVSNSFLCDHFSLEYDS